MKILIVENEKPAAEKLARILNQIEPSISIIGTTESVEATLNWFQSNSMPDLIFMDIQLDDGLCFELFELMNLQIPVIFTTAYNEYMLNAFKVNSVDYLLKPIADIELQQAIEKFKSIHYQKAISSDVLAQLFKEKTGYKNRFLIKVGEHYKSILTNEISCFYIIERATFIRTHSAKEYAVDFSLDSISKLLNPQQFFRINRNCVINIDSIQDILSYSSSRLKLKLNDSKTIENDLIVSKERVSSFKKWIDR